MGYLTQNVKTQLFKIQRPRLIKLVEILYPSAIGTKRYCQIEKTEQADTTKYVWDSKAFSCKPLHVAKLGEQNIEGSFPETELSISNINDVEGGYIESQDVRGSVVYIYDTFEGLTLGVDYLSKWKYRVGKVAYDRQSYELSFILRTYHSDQRNDFPLFPRDRNRCGWKFDADGTDEIAKRTCGFYTLYYDPAIGGTLDTTNYPNADATKCDKQMYSQNGCAAHFDQTNSLKPKMRARLYPGIPTTSLQELA